MTNPTTEGDPTTTYYRVGPGIDHLELFIDVSRAPTAATGRRGPTRSCPDTLTAAAPLGCAEA